MERLLKYILLMLGFSTTSCYALYAAPSVDYTVKGRVTDNEGKPVKGISVEYRAYNNDDCEAAAPSTTVYSDDKGKFFIQKVEYDFELHQELIFSDVDGEENGGQFASTVVGLTFSEKDITHVGEWTTTYVKNVGDVVLEYEQQQEE